MEVTGGIFGRRRKKVAGSCRKIKERDIRNKCYTQTSLGMLNAGKWDERDVSDPCVG